MLRRNAEPTHGQQFVVGVVRGSMTSGTALALEHLPSHLRGCIETVWIRRRLQGIDVQRQRVELFVAEALLRLGRRQLRELLLAAWYESAEARQELDSLRQRCIAH